MGPGNTGSNPPVQRRSRPFHSQFRAEHQMPRYPIMDNIPLTIREFPQIHHNVPDPPILPHMGQPPLQNGEAPLSMLRHD
jgi:hypothetical protein